ncbi:glycosyltransferase [Aquipseudomonas ullengensis]|uniref:Glycosyltransferase family 4 protein n=1 Tax=Aquipseudomonas ullengensis TaxID=2759166 RepID=A0A7W4LMV1_9GAMM|nr:glycosyltransferase [Pseudomonas ullengensis]MBB2496010.1 glycosyltransferase family 4 protein [Pseudomonas ullengensis]
MHNVLIIGYVWPEPRSSAAGSRMIEFIELFRAQGWRVTFASAAALSEHRADLAALDVPEVPITLNCDSFDAFLSELQPDLALFDRFFSEEQFGWRVEKHCPNALRVLETSDLHSLRDARQRLLKAAQQRAGSESEKQQQGPVAAGTDELFRVMADDDMAQREIAAIYRCDLSLMISDFEQTLLQQHFGVPAALLQHCTLMLIPTATEQPPFEQRAHFLSIGNFRHAPNWDSVLWLKQQIWPLIRQRLPQAQLHIYGSYPPPKATALHNAKQGFHVLGWAADAHTVMVQARVCLAPLRFGAGIKGKLADAMACGTPSVTTPIGSEGMHGELPWGGAIAGDAEAFAAAAVALYQDQTLWQQAQANGARILAERFDRQQSGQALIARLHNLRDNLQTERRANFVGGMLRHHLHKSTQYMSQWIAAKNRNPASNDGQ